MRILGRSANAGFLVDLSITEMSNLMGFDTYSKWEQSRTERVTIGDELQIAPVWKQLQFYKNYKDKLDEITANFVDMADRTRSIELIKYVEEPIEQPV